jgi:hypothetical protein
MAEPPVSTGAMTSTEIGFTIHLPYSLQKRRESHFGPSRHLMLS